MIQVIGRLIREPLVQFLLLGMALIVSFEFAGSGRTDAGHQIVVDDASVAAIGLGVRTDRCVLAVTRRRRDCRVGIFPGGSSDQEET